MRVSKRFLRDETIVQANLADGFIHDIVEDMFPGNIDHNRVDRIVQSREQRY
jgi:hypothetical protein